MSRLASLIATTVVFVLLALGAVPAFAGETHLLQASFGPDGSTATVFEQPAALGVDESTGDVYIADYAAGTVQKFNSAHEPSEFKGIAPNIKGGRLTGFSFFTTEPESEIAVNSTSHDFYVVNNGNKSVKAFQSDGVPAVFTAGTGAGTNEIGGFSELCGVAVDSNGDIYASDFGLGTPSVVKIYAPTGEFITKFTSLNSCQVAIDRTGPYTATGSQGRSKSSRHLNSPSQSRPPTPQGVPSMKTSGPRSPLTP